MRILITNHWLKKLGGSETFTYTMVKAAKEWGAEVDLFTHVPGLVSQRIEKDFGVKNQTSGTYDVVLASHNTTVKHCYDKGLGPIIQTIHGTIPKLERPSGDANLFVAISEEIKNHLHTKVSSPIHVILNGIDTNRFKDRTVLAPQIRSVLSFSHSEVLNSELRTQFRVRGIDFKTLNKYTNPIWEVEREIWLSDLVISLGRGAYEAMACGRPVLVLDDRPYQEMLCDGMVTPENIEFLVKYNFSGRNYRIKGEVNAILNSELPKYNDDNQLFYRQCAFDNVNYQKNFLKYITLCKNKNWM